MAAVGFVRLGEGGSTGCSSTLSAPFYWISSLLAASWRSSMWPCYRKRSRRRSGEASIPIAQMDWERGLNRQLDGRGKWAQQASFVD